MAQTVTSNDAEPVWRPTENAQQAAGAQTRARRSSSLRNLGESWLRGQQAPARQPTRADAGPKSHSSAGARGGRCRPGCNPEGRRPGENRSLRPPARPLAPTVSGPGPWHLPGGLCAGLWKADRFSAAAFSRTVAMAAAAGTRPPQTTAPRSGRPRWSSQLTGPGWGGAPARPRPRRAPLAADHVPAAAHGNLRPRERGQGGAPPWRQPGGKRFGVLSPASPRRPHATSPPPPSAQPTRKQADAPRLRPASGKGAPPVG